MILFDITNLYKNPKKEKILLLNAALTVKKGKSNSHQKKWCNITDDIIKYISKNSNNVIFLLLGNNFELLKADIKLIKDFSVIFSKLKSIKEDEKICKLAL